MSLPFLNRYTHRTAARESSCFICGKFTTAVLTHKDIDWFYVCVNHINDSSFCKPVNPPPPPTPSPATNNKKPAASVNKSKPVEKKDAVDGDVKKKDEEESTEKKANEEPPQAKPPVVKTGPKEYILDSKIFYLRENQYRQKISAKKAKQVAAQFPSVPSSTFSK